VSGILKPSGMVYTVRLDNLKADTLTPLAQNHRGAMLVHQIVDEGDGSSR